MIAVFPIKHTKARIILQLEVLLFLVSWEDDDEETVMKLS